MLAMRKKEKPEAEGAAGVQTEGDGELEIESIEEMPEEAPSIGGMISGFKISKQLAIAAAVVLLVLAVALTFIAFGMLVSPPKPTIQPEVEVGAIQYVTPPKEMNYTESPLVRQYGVTSTPQLAFNCARKRVGTFAQAEAEGRVPRGTEKQDLINILCDLTGKKAFCDRRGPTEASSSLQPSGAQPCSGSGGRVLLYAFHSPSCGMSAAQRPVLSELAAEFPDELQLEYICSPVLGPQDFGLCRQGIIDGEYSQ